MKASAETFNECVFLDNLYVYIYTHIYLSRVGYHNWRIKNIFLPVIEPATFVSTDSPIIPLSHSSSMKLWRNLKSFRSKVLHRRYFSCRRCSTLDLNDFRFLHNFIELEWLSGIIGESVDTKVAGSIPGRKIFLILQLW